jgi:hypothetical protein
LVVFESFIYPSYDSTCFPLWSWSEAELIIRYKSAILNDWESRFFTPKGRELLKTMESNNLKHLSAGEPIYCPSNRNKVPELVDFCVTESILQDFALAKSCFDLSSSHSSVFVTLTTDALIQGKESFLSNRHTNWDDCRRPTLNISIKPKKTLKQAAEFSRLDCNART